MVMLAGNSFIQNRLSFVGLLIYNDLSKVVNNAKVWNAFLKWSTLRHGDAIDCISGGTFPFVDCTSTDGQKSGCFSSKDPTTIGLNYNDVQKANLNADTETRNQQLKLIESTLLHELVHWGRSGRNEGQPRFSFIKGKWQPDHYGTIDVGKRFEIDAYTNPDKPWIP